MRVSLFGVTPLSRLPRHDRAPPELPHRSAGGANYDRSPGVEVHPKASHSGIKDQSAVSGEAAEDRSVGIGTPPVAAPPEQSAHAASDRHGKNAPRSDARSPLIGGDGVRQRAHKHRHPVRTTNRSGTTSAPQR